MSFRQIGVLTLGIIGVIVFGLRTHSAAVDEAYLDGFNAAQQKYRLAESTALRVQAQHWQSLLNTQILLADQTVKALRAEKAATAKKTAELEEEIDYVTTTWTPPNADKPEAQPACMFTHGFVRVYNSAIGAADQSASNLSATVRAAGVDGATSPTQTPDPSLQPSSIQRSDILQHITGYGQQCQDTADQLNSLIDYLEKQGKRHASAG